MPSENLWHNHHQKQVWMLLSWDDLVSFLAKTSRFPPWDHQPGWDMAPESRDVSPAPGAQGCLVPCSFCEYFRSGLFHFLSAMHLDRFSQWLLKKWLVMEGFRIAEALNREEWSSHSSHVASRGLSDNLMAFSPGQGCTPFPFTLQKFLGPVLYALRTL